MRGLAVNRDDLLRRSVIMALMCQGEVLFESIELGHLIDFKSYFARELESLADLQAQGLVTLSDSGIRVTATGWYLVRAIAMTFDRYLQVDKDRSPVFPHHLTRLCQPPTHVCRRQQRLPSLGKVCTCKRRWSFQPW